MQNTDKVHKDKTNNYKEHKVQENGINSELKTYENNDTICIQ